MKVKFLRSIFDLCPTFGPKTLTIENNFKVLFSEGTGGIFRIRDNATLPLLCLHRCEFINSISLKSGIMTSENHGYFYK